MTKLLLELTKSNLLNFARNRSVLFATIAFPLIFIGVFGLAFNTGTSQTNSPISIAVVYEDSIVPETAIVLNESGAAIEQSQEILESYFHLLETITFQDNETNVFSIEYFTFEYEDDALLEVQGGDISAIIYLYSDFTLGYMASFRSLFSSNVGIRLLTQNFTSYPDSDYQTNVTIRGDQTKQEFSITASVLQATIEGFFSFGRDHRSGVELILNTNIATVEFSVFDYILPGLVIFGILQNLGTIAVVAVRDVESGLLRRLKITNMSGVEYALSLILSQLILSMLQLPIFFGVATFFGFPITTSIKYAFLIAILMSLSVSGLGLIISAFAKDSNSAGSLSTLVNVPMAFLAGAFFIVPNPVIVPSGSILGNNSLGLMDLLSATPAIEALRLILVGGRSISDVSFQIVLLSILTVIYLGIGIILYSKKHLTPEN